MSGYAAGWRIVCVPLALGGAVSAAALLPWSTVIQVFVCAAVVCGMAMLGSVAVRDSAATSRDVWRTIGNGLLAGAAVTAIVGLSTFIGAAVVPLILLVAATSPPAVRLYAAGLRRSRGEKAAGHGDVPAGDPELSRLSTAELCAQWCATFAALRQASPTEMLGLVERRQRCLDELERRDPDGLQAWLASSASGGSDPGRFLVNRAED